jgi:hypothetical protein
MGNKNPNYSIYHRPLFCLLRSLHVPQLSLFLIAVISPQITSSGYQITELVQEKSSLPFSAVHYLLPISSFSLGSMLLHINVKVVFVPIEPSVPARLPSIQNSPMAPSVNISRTMTLLSVPANRLALPMGKLLQRHEVDESEYPLMTIFGGSRVLANELVGTYWN